MAHRSNAVIIGTFAKSTLLATNPATITVPAPGAGLRLVVTNVFGMAGATGAAPTAGSKSLSLISGASGGSDKRWQSAIGVEATAGKSNSVQQSDLWIPMELNTAATLEFDASGTSIVEAVCVSGVIVQG